MGKEDDNLAGKTGDDEVDDFEFGTEGKGEENKGEEDKGEEGKGEEGKGEENKGEEGKGEEGKGEEGKGEEGKTGKGKTADIDIFADDESGDGADKKGKLSYKPIASDLGIELEEDSIDELRTKINARVESAKQDFKLDDYPDDAKAVIKHLKNNNGRIEDFLNNENIVSLQGVKNLKPEEKVLYVRTNELTRGGLTADKAQEQAEAEIEEMTPKDIRGKAGEIDVDADKLISREIKQITGDRTAKVAEDKEKFVTKTKGEITALKTYINEQKEFLGIKLTEKAKQGMIRDIETGAFDDIANKSPVSSKFAAYMHAKFGKNISDTLSKTSSEQNRKGYNAATDKSLGALHKDKDSARQGKSGHQQGKSGESGKFDGFADGLGEDDEI